MPKDTNTDYTQKAFLKLLAEEFGPYKERGAGYEFEQYTNKDIARFLNIDKGWLSRLLNHVNEESHSYQMPIDQVRLYSMAKKYEILQEKNVVSDAGVLHLEHQKSSSLRFKNRFSGIVVNLIGNYRYLLLLVLLSLSFLLGYFISQKSNGGAEKLTMNDGKLYQEGSDIYIEKIPDLDVLIDYLGRANIHRLAKDAVLLSIKYRSKENRSNDDLLALVSELQTLVQQSVSEARIDSKVLNYKIFTGEDFVDFINRVLPATPKALFKCSPEIVLRTKISDNLPDSATVFDIGLVASLPIILDENISLQSVATGVEATVAEAQDAIYDAISNAIKAERVRFSNN